MNWKQFYYSAGIGSEFRLVFRNSGLVREKMILTSIGEGALYFREDFGSTFIVTEKDEVDILPVRRTYQDKVLKDNVDTIRRQCNSISEHLSIGKEFVRERQAAVELLHREGNGDTEKLALYLDSENAIREHRITKEEAEAFLKTAEQYLNREPELSCMARFLICYGENDYSGAMKVLTDMLADDCASSVYKDLGLANLYLGKAEAMYLYWMGKYFLKAPERAVGNTSCGCSREWIMYLDTCGNLLCFKNLDRIMEKLVSMGDEYEKCVYVSLTRLFQRAGFMSLACEAASRLAAREDITMVGRPFDELIRFLITDEDSYCCFAFMAADEILRSGLENYTSGKEESRMGILYDFASGRHYGRILGYDLLTYFFAASNIPEKRKKEFNRNFDFSIYRSARKLPAPVFFRIGSNFNHNSYAIESFC